MANVSLTGVQKTYPNGFKAIHGINLAIADGEFIVIVGPSGCGKSTLLRMIAGLESITQGDLDIAGNRVNQLEPAQRDIAMVFQNYALYPHMSVHDNMAYGLKNRGVAKAEIAQAVKQTAEILELTPLLARKPRQLSGGQRQRVAMGRAIVRDPKVFLFDEPLSNLDAKLRVQMRIEIKKLQQSLGTTAVYVTHDQVEAMTLADRLVVMNKGVAEQIGTPMEIYHYPRTAFVAGFIGSPAMNFMTGHLHSGVLKLGQKEITLPDGPDFSGEVVIGIRPEHLYRSSDYPHRLDMRIKMLEPLGADTLVYGQPEGINDELVVRLNQYYQQDETQPHLPLYFSSHALHLFDKQTGLRINQESSYGY